jgi:threonine aldolase
VCIENTHNRGGGRIQPYDTVVEICAWARAHGLATHLDGARLFNAAVASGIDAAAWAQHFDTVSICFSKGLGAPVGSALTGPRDLIAEARRHRKLFGGGMRQAGIIAAGALYSLEHHVERLAEDHANAQRLADAIRQIEGLELRPAEVDTNLVIFHVDPAICTAAELSSRLRQRGVLINAFATTLLRAVTHLDVDRNDVERAAEALQESVGESSTTTPVGAAASPYA